MRENGRELLRDQGYLPGGRDRSNISRAGLLRIPSQRGDFTTFFEIDFCTLEVQGYEHGVIPYHRDHDPESPGHTQTFELAKAPERLMKKLQALD